MAYVALPKYPYDKNVKWTAIHEWERLDFVKALPDDVKEQLRKLPPEAEAEYDFCPISQKMMPRVNPERSREYWLRYYNAEYQPWREKNAKAQVILQHTSFCVSVERSLAHISEILEGMNRTLNHLNENLCQIYGEIHPPI